MMKCRRRQATKPQKLKKLLIIVFLFFVGGSGSVGKITASTSLLLSLEKDLSPELLVANQLRNNLNIAFKLGKAV